MGLAFIHFLWRTRKALHKYSEHEYETHVAKTVWIYLVLFFTNLGAAIVYMAQYYGELITQKDTPQFAVWGLWIFVAVAGSLHVALLAYLLTGSPHGAQSFFAVFLYFVAMYVGMYTASLAPTQETQLLWSLPALFLLLCVLVCFFWPLNKIVGDRIYREARDVNFSEYSTVRLLFGRTRVEQRESVLTLWAFVFRAIVLLQLVVSHCGLLVTFFVSDSQSFTTLVNLRESMICYTFFLALWLVPLAVIFSLLTFFGVVRRLSAVKRQTAHKTVDQRISWTGAMQSSHVYEATQSAQRGIAH